MEENSPVDGTFEAFTTKVGYWWDTRRQMVLRLAVGVMAVVALLWLGYQFWRLLSQSNPIWPSSPNGAVDLGLRYLEIHRWFAGSPVYGAVNTAVYPPASYAILWPLLGWLPLMQAGWLWAATSIAALYWLIRLMLQASGAQTALERWFVILLPLSMYATGATIGNGQIIVHLLPVLVAGLLLICREKADWRTDLLGALLVAAALVKPSLSVPFMWLVVFVPGRWRPIVLVSLIYGALNLFAASFQDAGLVALLQDLLRQKGEVTLWDGYANLHKWLWLVGLERWVLVASFIVLIASGIWTYLHRHVDRWLLFGITALIARFWMHHRWYDDLLVLLPMVVLFRIAVRSQATDVCRVMAGVLLAVAVPATLAPGGVYLFPPPWKMLYVAGQTIIWIAMLVFLLDQARREKRAAGASLAGRPGWSVSSR